MRIYPVHPEGWKKASGYSNGIVVEGAARLLFIAGQIAWNERHELVGRNNFGEQFHQALSNVIAVVASAGGTTEDLVEMTIFVTDKQGYLAALDSITATWRDLMEKTYPAMVLVEVADLLEDGALVEIQARAALASA